MDGRGEDRSFDFILSVERNRCGVLQLKKDKELIFQRNSRHDRVRLAFRMVFDNPSGYFISVQHQPNPKTCKSRTEETFYIRIHSKDPDIAFLFLRTFSVITKM